MQCDTSVWDGFEGVAQQAEQGGLKHAPNQLAIRDTHTSRRKGKIKSQYMNKSDSEGAKGRERQRPARK
ncbi:hypothetical protein VTN49DRAFT_6234 [Thermomyces lanuginosus]|uniref:uncharacterized protein n=1 Tax=Thermomyces lanuginosus TaxID=5541 RepID=UPI0037423284